MVLLGRRRTGLEGLSKKPTTINKIDEYYAKKNGKSYLPKHDTGLRKNFLKDIPVLTTADGTVVCIPKLKEMGLITIVGTSGKGKTLSGGYIMDNLFWLWKDAVVDMNDSQEETITWCEENDVIDFKMTLKKVKQMPMPLPIIYVFPNFDNLKIKDELLKERCYVVVSIPFGEIIENIEDYLPDLGGSLKYIVEKKDELLQVETEEDLFRVLKTIEVGKATDAVVGKAIASFKQLINEGILNITDPTAPPVLSVKDLITKELIYRGNPLTAIMKAECVPCFVTSELYLKKYKDAIFAYWLKSLFAENLKGVMKGRRVWVYFDELNKVVDIKPENNCPATERALNEIASRGRNNSISMLYATQSYHNIPRVIRSQTKYAVIFHHKDPKAAHEICSDFVLDKKTENQIRVLKKYEAIVATTEYFVCYKGEKRWESTGPFQGMTLPALHRNKFLNKKE